MSWWFWVCWPVLMIFCTCLTVFACTATPCMFTHMFGMPVWLLGLTWLCVGCLLDLTGKLGYFAVSQHVLMYSFTSAVMPMPLWMLGMSPCLLNTFNQFLWPSSPCLALPAPGFTPVLSPSPILTISLVFNTVEASIWPLNPFTLPLNTSPQLLWLSNPPAHVFMPPEHILLVLNTIEASGQYLFTYLCTDLDPWVNTRAEFFMGMGMHHQSSLAQWQWCPLPS